MRFSRKKGHRAKALKDELEDLKTDYVGSKDLKKRISAKQGEAEVEEARLFKEFQDYNAKQRADLQQQIDVYQNHLRKRLEQRQVTIKYFRVLIFRLRTRCSWRRN
jgi:hypothetical protein